MSLELIMCRYGLKAYKLHYVCFDCRKQFKRVLEYDILKEKYKKDKSFNFEKAYEKIESDTNNNFFKAAVCPDCKKELSIIGFDFQAPPKKDKKSWMRIKKIYQQGFHFTGCGCGGPGYIPRNATDFRNFDLKIEHPHLFKK